MQKRIKTGWVKYAAFLLVIFLSFFMFAGCSYKGDSKQLMEKLNITAEVQPNGDVNMKETWRVNLQDRNKAYRNFYRSFTNDAEKADGITDFSVYDEDYQKQYTYIGDIDPENAYGVANNTCYVHQTASQTEIGWFMPSIDKGVRTFTISYTIKNLVAVHQDTAVLYQFFVPQEFSMPIAQMACTIRLPEGGDKQDLRAWLHSTASGNLTIDSSNQVSFTAKEIPAKTFVDVRLCMPTKLFSASEKTDSKTVLPSILAEEQKWYNESLAEQRRQYLLGIADAVLGFLVLAAGIVALIMVRRKNRRIVVEVPEYTRDIPQGNSPGGIANLFYFYSGGVTKTVQGRVFSATMLSLAQKGYLSFTGSDKDYAVSLAPESTRKQPLTKSEETFFEMLQKVSDYFGGPFTMKQFKKFAKIDFKYIDRKIEQFLADAKQELTPRGYYRIQPIYLSVLKAVGLLGFGLTIALFVFSSSVLSTLVYLPIAILISSVLLLIAGSTKQKLSAAGEYDYGVWHGLKKYMLEFSRMKEYSVPQLTLWEEYLVYATMMGISKQVCEQLRLVYPELNDETYMNTYFGGSYLYYMFGSHYAHGFGMGGTDFGASLASTISDVSNAATRLAHPPTQSGGGGGGFGGGSFGGGGGGFGGGGGGVR